MEPNHQVNHLGIIMDGNRRWAKERGMQPFEGHVYGYKTLIDIVDHCAVKNIKILTIYVFSTENWKRTKIEVDFLLALFHRIIDEQLDELNKKNVHIRFIGDLQKFPESLQKKMLGAGETTKNNTGLILNIAANYGGRAEIVKAVKEIMSEGISANDVTEELISQHLYTSNLPDPDMIIRTSGEKRLSGFLTWQSIYSELLFVNIHWPDFTPNELDKALEEFVQRQRRFGK